MRSLDVIENSKKICLLPNIQSFNGLYKILYKGFKRTYTVQCELVRDGLQKLWSARVCLSTLNERAL